MSGPLPTAPSDIGGFIIGQSPIGEATVGGVQTIISQYANSPIILELIADFAEWIDPTASIQAWFDEVWNLQTAIGWGLDVWGRIVGVSRILAVQSTKYFGFDEATTASADPFNQSPFYGGSGLTTNYPLSDDAYRQLIYAKAAANIWDGSIPGLNLILRLLFPGQVAYVTDGEDMTMTYTFGFLLNPVQLAVIANSGVLPRPAGVSTSIVQI